MEPSKKISINYMIILGVICIFILAIFMSGYIYITKGYSNSYENNLNVYIKTINKVNISTEGFMKEGTINAEVARHNIPSVISTLQKCKDKILILNATDNFKFSKASLIQGLTNNINIYAQLINVLNNPGANDISSTRNNIKNFEDICIDSYSQACVGKVKIGLQKNTISFINSSIYYLDQLVKIKKNQSISDSERTDFIKVIDETFKNFQVVKTDFKTSLYSVRNNNNYDDLINIVSRNKTDLSNLKIDFTKISVPQKSLDSNPIVVFNTFKNAMNDYDLYLDSFTYALANEKVQASYGSIDKNIVNNLYTESDIKMSLVTKDYNSFIEIYNGFKDIK